MTARAAAFRGVLLLALALLGLMVAARPAHAHALQPGYLELTLQGPDRWSVLWRIPDLGGQPMPITAVLPATCTPATAPEPRFDGAAWSSAWLADCPGGLEGGSITIRGLAATQADVLVRYELRRGAVETRRLTAAEPGFAIPAPQGIRGIAATYGPLGVSHILAGVDHLLFVFALLLLVRDRWQLVGTVTAFTLAHSLSLAAATLGWIVVPAPPVEAVVALSIMFLAAELVKPEGTGLRLTERYPSIVAFAFGLLHGLGFASALREIGLPEGEVALALLFFNLGVEAGQLLFIALVLLAGAIMARLYPSLIASVSNRGQPAARFVGYAIGSLSAAWLVARAAAF